MIIKYYNINTDILCLKIATYLVPILIIDDVLEHNESRDQQFDDVHMSKQDNK